MPGVQLGEDDADGRMSVQAYMTPGLHMNKVLLGAKITAALLCFEGP